MRFKRSSCPSRPATPGAAKRPRRTEKTATAQPHGTVPDGIVETTPEPFGCQVLSRSTIHFLLLSLQTHSHSGTVCTSVTLSRGWVNNVKQGRKRMELGRMTARGQTTIPKRVREEANLNAGDLLSFEVQSDHLVVRKLPGAQDTYLHGVSRTLDDWNSPEDETAWRNL